MGASVRHRWIQAVRRSDLHPHARLICFVFVEYVHASDPGAKRVWVAHDALLADTGLSTNTAAKYRDHLVALGWLVITEKRRGVRPARYALKIPPSLSTIETLETDDPESLESQRLRLENLRQGLISEELGSQMEGSRVSMVEGKPLRNRKEPRRNPGLVPTSPGPANAEIPDHEFAADDPWARQQELDAPPAHVGPLFAALRMIRLDTPEPDLTVCSHGVMSGLKFGGGEYACCPPTPEEP
jgi:hypothetical protein